MSALDFAERSTARRFAAPSLARLQARTALRAAQPQQAPSAEDDDLADAVPWLTIYADEDEPGSSDEVLMEAPMPMQQVPWQRGSASL